MRPRASGDQPGGHPCWGSIKRVRRQRAERRARLTHRDNVARVGGGGNSHVVARHQHIGAFVLASSRGLPAVATRRRSRSKRAATPSINTILGESAVLPDDLGHAAPGAPPSARLDPLQPPSAPSLGSPFREGGGVGIPDEASHPMLAVRQQKRRAPPNLIQDSAAQPVHCPSAASAGCLGGGQPALLNLACWRPLPGRSRRTAPTTRRPSRGLDASRLTMPASGTRRSSPRGPQ